VSASNDLLHQSVRAFLDATAAKTPTPGGGSVAGVAAALGVALGEMALNFTRGKKKYAAHEPAHAKLAAHLARAREMFQQLVADDVSAYGLYSESTRMDAGAAKDQAVQLATAAAINVPRELMKLALAVLDDLAAFAETCNPYLITDLMAAAALLLAAVRLSDYNVRVNLPNLADPQDARDLREASAADLARAEALQRAVEQAGNKILS